MRTVNAGRKDSTPHCPQLRYGHYEICLTETGDPWELGRGSMGITYKATDTVLRCTVALKIINTHRLGGSDARERFLQEARTAAQLRHANIASVFHLGTGEENCFYAMDYIEGETLEALVQRAGTLPWRVALNVVIQSARALRVAHAHYFIHRDIKPTNIMLMADGPLSSDHAVVKLIDFGLVKAMAEDALGDLICESYFAGTPHYASPEQILSGVVDARSDIYSLGMCLGYMLTGKPLGPGESLSIKSRLPEEVPASVVALLKSMMSSDAAMRPQTADELLDCLADCHDTSTPSDRFKGSRGDTHASSPNKGRDRLALIRYSHTAAIFVGLLVASIASVAFLHPRLQGGTVDKNVSISSESKVLCAQGTECLRKHTKSDTQQAIQFLSKAILLSPAYVDAYAMLASAQYVNVCRYAAPTKQLDLAIANAQHAIALAPASPKAFQVLGAIRSFHGEPWEALTQLHRALELDSKAALVMCDFSLLWSCVGRPQLALPWAKEATRIEPSNVQSWHAAAEASVELCADEQAEEYYKRCTELQPVWMSGHCGLIHLYLLQGDIARARQECAKAESIQPDGLPLLTLKAQTALFSGEYVDAESLYRHLLVLNRFGMVRYYSGISYLSALGFLSLQTGEEVQARAFLDEAEKMHPANSQGPEDIYDLAAIRAIQQRNEDALMLLSQAISSGWNDYRAIRLDPRFTSLRNQPRFLELLESLQSRIAQSRKEAEILCAKPLRLADYPVGPQKNLVK